MFKCIKEFSLPVCDDNGSTLEDKFSSIEEGSVWDIPEDEEYRFIGGEVRLENDELGWIEISEETFKACFELIS